MDENKKSVSLLSGGLDSTTTLAIAKAGGYKVWAISFRYGQRHSIELDCAKRIASKMDVREHLIFDFDLRAIGGSALTSDIDVPRDRTPTEMATMIPLTYVPARNTIFLAFALAWAERLEAANIFIGVNAIDYSGYPDCRPEYIKAFERMANLATRISVTGEVTFKIHTPLIHMTKSEIIRTGLSLGVDYSLTHSCYDPSPQGFPCGSCDSCLLRINGFEEAGITDPLIYQNKTIP